MRRIATFLAAITLAATSQAAEITGTVVSNDPTGGTVVVRTNDGQTVTIRTDATTRVQQGDAVVETTTLLQGVPVQVVTTDVVTGEAAVAPVASRILLVPSAPAAMEDDVDTDDDDVDVDVDTDDDDIDDD